MDKQDYLQPSSNDPINPNHYKTESGVQAIDIAELFPYSLGNAIKYAWRAGKKDDLKQDLEKCEWYLNRAMANGEDSLFMSYHPSVLRARRLFAKLNKTDLPELNYELVSSILDGRLGYALTHIDDCPVCSDPETYRTWDDIVADEIEHQATKRLARPQV